MLIWFYFSSIMVSCGLLNINLSYRKHYLIVGRLFKKGKYSYYNVCLSVV
jgi:hypothetical protein